ncbi:MAG TPA: GTP 3',8-cyclase MoaA [Solirubrobacteraceae bacterium]
MERLVDGFGRAITSLRISVTDRCNLRCTYCMPEHGATFLPRTELLSYEEIERLVGVAAAVGVSEVRLTGGEPLVRRDLPELVRRLARLPVEDLSLTTNGVLLERHLPALVAAGLRRVNVSLDAVQAHRFAQITRRDELPAVMAALRACEDHPQLRPIKVNAVAQRGVTDDEVLGLAELARRRPYIVRFIEFMPLDADAAWSPADVLTGDEIRDRIDARWPLVELPAPAASTSRRFAFADGAGEVGFINPVSQPFCRTCDRIRLTADGQLRTCLFSTREHDLRAVMRDGGDDATLLEALRAAVGQKELKHRINEPGFVPASRSMHQIGG